MVGVNASIRKRIARLAAPVGALVFLLLCWIDADVSR
jgi:hypothetical protein